MDQKEKLGQRKEKQEQSEGEQKLDKGGQMHCSHTADFIPGPTKPRASLEADQQDRWWQWQWAVTGECADSLPGVSGVTVIQGHPDKAVICPVALWGAYGVPVCQSTSLLRLVLVWQFLILWQLCSLCLVYSLVMFCMPSVSSLSAFSSVHKIISQVQCKYVCLFAPHLVF